MKKRKSAIILLSFFAITILLTGFASAGFFSDISNWFKNLFKPSPQFSPVEREGNLRQIGEIEPYPEPPPENIPPCTDTDGGINPAEKGELVAGSTEKKDECNNENQLSEYFCQDNNADATTINCPEYGEGFVCIDGTCVKNVKEKTVQHAECINSMCVQVEGTGENRCSSDADCNIDIEIETHAECEANTCITVEGAGEDQCLSDSDCAPVVNNNQTNQTHTRCAEDRCVWVPGAGENLCVTNEDCIEDDNETNPEEEHAACITVDGESGCWIVPGEGENRCESDEDCIVEANETHTECSQNRCIIIQGPGIDECFANIDCQSPSNRSGGGQGGNNISQSGSGGAGQGSNSTNNETGAPRGGEEEQNPLIKFIRDLIRALFGG